MDYNEKITELQDLIRQAILPVIGSKAILVDAPYYNNIGDVLIWQGILDFLKANNIKLLSSHSCDTFRFQAIPDDVTILMMGGGNFGDLYPWAQNMRRKVIEHYPTNKIVMFPQSVWYENKALVKRDAEEFSAHKNLYLFARDNWSYNFLKTNFSCNVILKAPDMAFYIDSKRLEKYRGKEEARKLYFKRIDKELTPQSPDGITGSEIHDWPSCENSLRIFPLFKYGYASGNRLLEYGIKVHSLIDKAAIKLIKNYLVKMGCDFLKPYNEIITTRLHAMILSILLYKPVKYIDNSTNKLSAFADTWLIDFTQVQKYE
ncbi:MAG: polysaccharide pyruvyl transferase YvfF [Bacteroides sp.]|nr:polysaccharide pyruvyl transferase YvfF [Bacteroides sp.]